MNKVTTSIILDTRRKRHDKTYPVKLRLNCQRKRRLFGIDYFMTSEYFDKVMAPKARNKEKSLRKELAEIEKKANTIIDAMPVFNFDLFKKQFADSVDYSDLFKSLEYWIKEYERQGRPGTASTFHNTLKSWQAFYKPEKLPFTRINPKLLNEYEQHMKTAEKSITTVGIYMRNVRRMYNLAILAKDVKQELYPFGKKEDNLYEIPEGVNFKRALPKSDIKKIFQYDALEGSPEQFYRDLWTFSYLCNGMNIADIARLKYKDNMGSALVFIRKKTERTKKRDRRPIIVEKDEDIINIIERWGNKPPDPESYIFDVLRRGISPADELARVKQLTKQVNKYIKRIAKAVGIEGNISSYSARHSFASVLKQSGESTVFIQEALGHKDLKTTENYLISFDSKQRRKAQKNLTNWDN